MKMEKKKVFFILKVVISLILLGCLLNRFSLTSLHYTVRDMHWLWLGAGYMSIWVTLFLHAWRWQWLLKGEGTMISYPNLFNHYLIGYFFSHFLPKAVGGDAVRALSLAKNGLGKTRSLTIVLVGRFIGVATIFLALIVCTLLSGEIIQQFPFSINMLLEVALIGLSTLVLGFVFLTSGLISKASDKWFKPIAIVVDTLRTYRNKWSYLVIAFLCSVVLQAVVLFRHYCVAQAVGLQIDFTTLSIVSIIVMAITSVPITINGVGLRENGFVFLLGFLSISPEKAFTFSLMNYALMICMAVIGGIVYIRSIQLGAKGRVENLSVIKLEKVLEVQESKS